MPGAGAADCQRPDAGVFIAELRRYRPGWLNCANEVSSLRISGTFKLDDTEQILRAIGKTLPVRVERRTKYWVSIEPSPPENIFRK